MTGHVPVVGEWLALFDEIFHPTAERLLARCDAVLRVGGASHGADRMVQVARERGLAVFSSLHKVPGCG
jgi:molybdopterin biosynthesis enzyme